MKVFSRMASLPHFVLSGCLYLALIRGTNMGLFYPSAEDEIGGIDYTYHAMMNIVLLVGLGSYFLLKNDYSYFLKSISSSFIGLIGAGILVSLAASIDVQQSLKAVLALLVVTLPPVLYCREFGAEKLLRALGVFMAWMAIFNILYVFIFPEYAIMSGKHEGAWRGMFEHKNPSGSIFGLGIFLSLLHMDIMNIRKGIPYILGGLSCMAFMAMSKSSTAVISTFVMGVTCCLVYFLLRLRTGKDRVLIVLSSATFLVIVYVFMGDDLSKAVFAALGKDQTLTGRTEIWAAVFDLVGNRPLFGYGPGMTERPDFMQQLQGAVGWELKSMHNSYLDVLIGYGYVVAVMIFCYILMKLFQAILAQARTEKDRIILTITTGMVVDMLVVCFTESGGLLSRSIVWIFIVCGICIIIDYCKTISARSYPNLNMSDSLK